MKPRTKGIVFFVILIAVVITMSLVVGDRTDASRPKATYSEFLQQVQAGEVSRATIAVAETGADSVTYRMKNGSERLTIIPRDYQEALNAMQAKMVNIEIRNVASQRTRVFLNATPFLVLLAIWFFMMIAMRKNPNLPRMFQG